MLCAMFVYNCNILVSKMLHIIFVSSNTGIYLCWRICYIFYFVYDLHLEDKVALASKVIFDSTSIIMSLSDKLQCGVLISEELVGVDLITETRFDDELLCSSVIPREASMLMPSRIISPTSDVTLVMLNLDCIK